MNAKAIRTAIRVLRRHAKERFDACCSASGVGFVCGTCPDGNAICAKEHAEIVRATKDLQAMVRRADNSNKEKT